MKSLISTFLLYAGVSWAGDANFPVETIDSKIKEYEEKLVECEEIESKRFSPGKEALDILRKYSEGDVRRFLVSMSSISLHGCTMPEIGEAYFIVGAILESREVSEEVRKYAADKQYLLHVSSWGFYEHLNNLPSDMQAELSKYDYFEEPFDALKVLDKLGIF